MVDATPNPEDCRALLKHVVHQQTSSDQQRREDKELLEHENHLFSAHKEMGPSKPKEITTWKLALNVLSFMEGVGFLALPYAIKEGGITAVVAFFVLPFILGYTANLLAECLDEEDEFGGKARMRWTYQDIAMDCWALFKPITWFLITFNLFMTTVAYIVLCSSLMSQQFPQAPITESQWACLATLLVLPTVFLKQFSQIAWISLISILALVGSASTALFYEFQKIPQWDIHSILFWDTRGVFVSLSMIIYSYSCHSVSVPMAADVSDQSKFTKALALAYSFGAVYKIVFAISGFLTYTSASEEVIFNNLPVGIPTKVNAVFFTLNVLLTYPISLLIVLRNIEELSVYEKLINRVLNIPPKISYILLRIFVPLAILAVAVGMPHLALINAFSGCVYYLLCLSLPGLFHLRLKYKKLSKFQKLVDVILIIVGVISLGFGLVTAIMSYMKTFKL